MDNDVNKQDPNHGKTELMRASEKGRQEVVENLLSRGADPNKQDKNGNTALMYASAKGYKNIVKILLTEGRADPNIKTNEGSTALIYTSSQGYEEVASLLLDNGADINAQAGVNVQGVEDKDTSTALIAASQGGHEKVVRLLLDRGADPYLKDEEGDTALMYACLEGYTKVLKIFLEKRVSPDSQNNGGITALMYASVREMWKEIIQVLLEGGADPNIQDTTGKTALMYAASTEVIKSVKILLDGGADPNIQNNIGVTALLYAVKSNNIAIIQSLLTKGADPNIQEEVGGTALMYACSIGNKEVVQLLLERGANPDIRDDEGDTALKIAKRHDYQEIVKLLRAGSDDIHLKIEELKDFIRIEIPGQPPIRNWELSRALQSSKGCYGPPDVSGVLCNVVDLEDTKNDEYLRADPGNLIFMIPFERGYNAYGYHVDSIASNPPTEIFYECKEDPLGSFRVHVGSNETHRYNFEIDSPCVKVGFPSSSGQFNVYLPVIDVIRCFLSGERVFLIEEGERVLSHTVSYDIARGHLKGIPYNMVSGDHCQSGTDKKLSEIFVCYGDMCMR